MKPNYWEFMASSEIKEPEPVTLAENTYDPDETISELKQSESSTSDESIEELTPSSDISSEGIKEDTKASASQQSASGRISFGRILLLIFIGIPIGIPFLILMTLVMSLTVILAAICSLALAALSLFAVVGGFGLIVCGIQGLAVNIPNGLLLIGAAFVLIALGLLLVWLTVKMACGAVPGIASVIPYLYKNIHIFPVRKKTEAGNEKI